MAEIETFRPRLKVLNKEQVHAIHSSALNILATLGVKMEHPGALVQSPGEQHRPVHLLQVFLWDIHLSNLSKIGGFSRATDAN